MKHRLHASRIFARRFAVDRRGVAALEFAFVAPILIIFYLGMAEMCQLLMAKRRVDHAGAAIADLVAQFPSVTPTDLDSLKQISTTIMAPFPVDRLTVRVTSVKDDANGAPKVVWSWPTGGPAAGSTPTFTTGTPLNPGESVVVAEVSYAYSSGVGYLITTGRTLNHKAELRPRKNDEVLCPTC